MSVRDLGFVRKKVPLDALVGKSGSTQYGGVDAV